MVSQPHIEPFLPLWTLLFAHITTIAHSGFEPSASPVFSGASYSHYSNALRLVNYSKRSVLYFSYCPEISFCLCFLFVHPAGLWIYSSFTRSFVHSVSCSSRTSPYRVSTDRFHRVSLRDLAKSASSLPMLNRFFKFFSFLKFFIYLHRPGACSEQ